MAFWKKFENVFFIALFLSLFFGVSVGLIMCILMDKNDLIVEFENRGKCDYFYQQGFSDGRQKTILDLNDRMREKGLKFCQKEEKVREEREEKKGVLQVPEFL